MSAIRFDRAALDFLADLEQANRRDWFEPRRHRFDELLARPFAALLEQASVELGHGDWPMRGGPATVARQLRDQRYARERPYATSMRGLLTSTGSSPTREGCVHVELATDGGFVGAGFHRPPRAVIDPIRRRIVAEPDRWRRVRHGLDERERALVDERSTRMPAGFAGLADHDHAADLRLRSLVLVERLDPDDWVTGRAVDVVVALALDAMPLLRFGNDAWAAATGVDRSADRGAS